MSAGVQPSGSVAEALAGPVDKASGAAWSVASRVVELDASAAAPAAGQTGVAAPAPVEDVTATIASNGTYPDFSLTSSFLDVTDIGTFDFTVRAMKLINWLHEAAGLEWGGAVVAFSLGVRLVTMPLFLLSVRTNAGMQEHMDALSQFTTDFTRAKDAGNLQLAREVMQQRSGYMKAHGLKMRYIFAPILAQMPIFYCSFKALRLMAQQAHLLPGFAAGAAGLGVAALHLPGPLWLPALGTGLAVASVAINNNMAGIPQASLTAKGQRLLFGVLSAVFGIVSVNFPADLQLYMTVTSATMLLQQLILRVKPLRDAMGFPANWPLASEIIAERARRREESGVGAGIMSGIKSAAPFFARVSAAAEGDFAGKSLKGADAAGGEYLGRWGLRNPGVPPPPPMAAAIAAAAASAPVAAAAQAGLAAAGEAAAAAAAAVPASAATPGALLSHKPKKAKK